MYIWRPSPKYLSPFNLIFNLICLTFVPGHILFSSVHAQIRLIYPSAKQEFKPDIYDAIGSVLANQIAALACMNTDLYI